MTVPFLDALPGQCRRPLWPLSQRTGDVCGEPVKPGSSYCRACHPLLYDPATKARVNTINAVVGRIVRDAARRQPSPNIHPEFEEAK